MGEPQTVTTSMTDSGLVRRDEFGVQQAQTQAETSMAAVAAREQAKIQAAYVMAERHPRMWDVVRRRMLDHCQRYGFAVIARYRKPVGKELINGEWVQKHAEGLSTQFAQVARQEMGNLSAETSVVYEDNRLRIVRAGVVDYERNTHEWREIVISKTIEKRGNRKGAGWEAPEGREVISKRLNTYGESIFLCVATEDEVMKRQNAEISKAHRDCTLRMIPKDIRDEAEAVIETIKRDQIDRDPAAFRKKIIDSFAPEGIGPEDLMTYLGCALDKASKAQIAELRDLYSAIKENETTFQEALKAKYAAPEDGQHEEGQQKKVAEGKIADLKKEDKPKTSEPTTEEMDAATKAQLAKESEGEQEQPQRRRISFPGRREQ